MTRTHLIILGVVLVVLLVVFGRNPAQEYRLAKPKRAGDRLMQNIEDYAKKPHFDLLQGGATNDGLPPPAAFQTPGQNPYTRANPYNQPPPKSNQPPPANDYYPPRETQPQPGKPQSGIFPFGRPAGFYLKNGQKITFAGADVYTINAQGQKVHLADGVYPMFGGAINMVVRGGKKVILTN